MNNPATDCKHAIYGPWSRCIDCRQGPWIPVADAASVVNKSKGTMYRWIASGDVPTYTQIDGTILVDASQLQDAADRMATSFRTKKRHAGGAA